jgi:hypothetical protein
MIIHFFVGGGEDGFAKYPLNTLKDQARRLDFFYLVVCMQVCYSLSRNVAALFMACRGY